MRLAYLGAVASNTRPDLRAMMRLAPGRGSGSGTTVLTLSSGSARRGGRVLECLAKRRALRLQLDPTRGPARHFDVHSGAFKTPAQCMRNETHWAPSVRPGLADNPQEAGKLRQRGS